MITPFTLLKINNALSRLASGETLEVLWSDPDTSSDFLRLLPASSCDLIVMEAMETENEGFRMALRKR